MLMVVSPAKALDFESPRLTKKYSDPAFLPEAKKLVGKLKKMKPSQLSELMNISDNLGQLNHQRYHEWRAPFDLNNARQAIFAFKGDVYLGLNAEQFSGYDLNFAQKHLRILSGLYGILRPLDLMQPYRLEMGTRFATDKGKNLYEYWGSKLTESLNSEIAAQPKNSRALINLASKEYFSVLQPDQFDAQIVTPIFKDYVKGNYKVLMLFAKQARGAMAAWVVKNRITQPADLKQFAENGYCYSEEDSSMAKLVFKRKDRPQGASG